MAEDERMTSADVLLDAFGRVRDNVHRVLDGLGEEQLAFRIDGRANSIAWLVWHLTRIQDDHLADAAGTEQVWLAGGWCDRFALPYEREATGYGHSPEDVARIRVGAELLRGYFDAVHENSQRYLRGLADADLTRVVDTRWTPPVTLGVRLVSVVSDDLQHVGQAAFVRGLLG